ncbi:MAG: fatty acyl-AMP ligase [Deltaproteobacteria bacterium]|nr:fatty acyl-AMP ligase [Deltaproteobacteria bacterium]
MPFSSNLDVSTLIELLRCRAQRHPEQYAYTFLDDGETNELHLTYKELDRKARAIGALLQRIAAEGERALLLYPQGLEYIAAFFGSIYAGTVAVPVYPPDPLMLNRTLPRLLGIAKDAQASIILTTSIVQSMAQSMIDQAPDLKDLKWLVTDNLEDGAEEDWQEPIVDKETVVFLQYTSGSTSAPKGVKISHGNLLHNQRMIQEAFEHTDQSTFVGWLPLYHDMGLVGNLLQPLYIGARCILMSPFHFLKRPVRWLQAISRYQAQTSGGPNFGYDLCVRKVTAEQKKDLNLSSWSLAFNGAEPIRAETLERFVEAFEPCGFRRETFYPCYGLAEATLLVSGGMKKAPPFVRTFLKTELQRNEAIDIFPSQERTQTLVSCGHAFLDQKIVIVDPETLKECSSGHIGEIWIAGPSVAQGYWNRGVETELTFRAYLVDTEEGPFLRTGDLGFLKEGELFVTGRLKDLIIMAGQNYYPQDIEYTVERSHSVLRPGCSAAFSIDFNDAEQLVILAEINAAQNFSLDEVTGIIRRTVGQNHNIPVHDVCLLKAGTIPKTSSGKIQRHACKTNFLNRTLDFL